MPLRVVPDYGNTHQQLRRLWSPRVEAGEVWCHRPTCQQWIQPGTPWDLGHDDDTGDWRGPEHRACNRGASARNTNAKRAAKVTPPHHSRKW